MWSAPADGARRVEYRHGAPAGRWFRCVLAPRARADDDLALHYVNERSVTVVRVAELDGDALRLPEMKWAASDEKKAARLIEQLNEAAAQNVQTEVEDVERSSQRKGRKGARCEAQKAEDQVDDTEQEEAPNKQRRTTVQHLASLAEPVASAAVATNGFGRPLRAAASRARAKALINADADSNSDLDSSDESRPFVTESDSDEATVRGRKRRRSASSPNLESDKRKPMKPAPAVRMKPSRPAGASRKRTPKQCTQPFVDPAGLDVEDRGVEWIVQLQCMKLLPVIKEALSHKELTLSMATACSGTDSPVVAMRVAQELLARQGICFAFEHVMSCEIEPYKQSFIARNNPGVLLFPDICELGATPVGREATTVYGGKAMVPAASMIVAGTSCKDFSNLKGRDRKSIEAMGTSGETFMGFVDLLFQQGYDAAILENVQGAEWDKMAHYITGKLPLYSIRPNKNAAGKHVPKELAFQVEGAGLIVTEVSQFAGVRVGAKLLGYAVGVDQQGRLLSAANEGELVTIKPGKFKKGRTIGLEELKKVFGLDDTHVLIFEMPVVYRTRLAHMDAKEFGLPQTRTRNYMFIWRPERYPKGIDVGDMWTEIVDMLRCPLKYSVDSFLLTDENDRIRRFRDALQGPLGRLTAMSRQSGDWWGPNSNKDTDHTKAYRNCTQADKSSNCLQTPVAETSRPFTNWGPNGHLSLASPRWWPEYMSVLTQRELDLTDCFGIKAAESGIDALHHSLWWNISQNVGRTDVIPRPGITGCITPGGEPFGPHIGRCILGYEKLLLSGIPADKLLIGTETEVQLSDLAGNAMAMPVVSAAILAALLLPAYSRMRERGMRPEEIIEDASGGASLPSASPKGSKNSEKKSARKDKTQRALDDHADNQMDLIDQLRALLPLCEEAVASSILCSCESSGGLSASEIVQCSDCLLTTCRSCGATLDLRSHCGGAPADHASCQKRHSRQASSSPALFEQTLRSSAPTTLLLDTKSAEQLRSRGADVPGVSCDEEGAGEYRLTRVLRERNGWTLRYSACNLDVGTPLAEVRVTIGRLGSGRGIAALLYSFAPALRGERGKMPPIARLLIPYGTQEAGHTAPRSTWELFSVSRECEISIEVVSRVPSYRSELGLLHYEKEHWPGSIKLEATEGDVSGMYERMPCRFSSVFGALWQRRAADGEPPLWLFVLPTVDRTMPDQLVVANSPCYLDCDSHLVMKLLPKSSGEPQTPFDFLNSLGAGDGCAYGSSPQSKKGKRKKESDSRGAVKVDAQATVWEAARLVFHVPPNFTRIETHEFGCVLQNLPPSTTKKLLSVTTGTLGHDVAARRDDKDWLELKVLTASSTITERRLAEAVAAPLLAFAAEGKLDTLAGWQHLEHHPGDSAWGECRSSAPPRPAEVWTDEGERTYDVEESNAFEQALRNRPSPWDVHIRPDGQLKIAARPSVAAHRAAEALVRGRSIPGNMLRIEWALDTQRICLATAPVTSFSIPTSKDFDSAPERPPFFKAGKVLYARQARALGRMLQIDDGKITFEEMEMSDHPLSNGIGWSLKVKALHQAPLRGGVLADAVGAGKTVCALALIASRAKLARQAAAAASNRRHSSATLVVAPVHCLKPVWRQMLDEFTSGLKYCVVEQLDDLLALSVHHLRNADIVIVACELLYNLKQRQPEAYQTHLTNLVDSEELPGFLKGRRQTRLIGSEPDVLTGVWVPNSSQDPFGKSAARQDDRDTAALFTARYHSAISKLREMEFDDDAVGVPIEWFEWERLVIDECHESLVMSQDDAEREAAHAKINLKEESKMEREKRKCAQRELLGIGQADLAKRPLYARKTTWGLTGTPLLSSETRITELATLCGGTYVCGNAAHWRTMERASTRDVFLRYHESASSLIYLHERNKAAQTYIDAAVQRNRIDNELSHISVKQVIVNCKLPPKSDYEKLLGAKKLLPNMNPSFEEVKSEVSWDNLLNSMADAQSRHQALRDLIDEIHAKEEWAKVVVFAPSGVAFNAAADALRQLRKPAIIGDPNDPGSTDEIDKFSRPDIHDRSRPLVLLMSFDYSSALNLQHVSHHIIFFSPLWGEDSNGVHASANEQQAIGRVVRIGQSKDVVVHRLVAVGSRGEETIEARIVERNTSERVTRQAVIT